MKLTDKNLKVYSRQCEVDFFCIFSPPSYGNGPHWRATLGFDILTNQCNLNASVWVHTREILNHFLLRFWTWISNKYTTTLITSHWLWPSLSQNFKKNLRSLYSTDRGVCDEWDRPATIKGTLGCFPDSCLILAHFSESDLGNAAIVRRAPKLPLCSPPSPPLLFSQRAKRENACATMPALLHLS